MASMNRVMLMGNLTRDPQTRDLPSGTTVCDLGLAVSERFKNKAGEQVEQTCFVDVVVWGRQAQTCGEYLAKGAPVFVEGRLQFDQWESKEGEKRSKLRVRADRVQFLGKPSRGAGYAENGGREGGLPAEEEPPVEAPAGSAAEGSTAEGSAPF